MAGEQTLASGARESGSVIRSGYVDALFLKRKAPQPSICTRTPIMPMREAYVYPGGETTLFTELPRRRIL